MHSTITPSPFFFKETYFKDYAVFFFKPICFLEFFPEYNEKMKFLSLRQGIYLLWTT